jgi:hypothetical protein
MSPAPKAGSLTRPARGLWMFQKRIFQNSFVGGNFLFYFSKKKSARGLAT